MYKFKRVNAPYRIKGIIPPQEDIDRAYDLLESCCELVHAESVSERVFKAYLMECFRYPKKN